MTRLRFRYSTWRIAVAGLLSAVAPWAALAAPSAATTSTVRELLTVKSVLDGDTIAVYDASGVVRSVRMIGLNAMETAHVSEPGSVDECHGQQAKRALQQLVRPGDLVQLRAMDGGSRSGERWRRSVWVDPDRDGDWTDAVDVQRVLLEAGLAVWLPNVQEWSYNHEYNVVASKAAAHRSPGTIWDDAACGVGPSHGAKLKIWANWDADGFDAENINGEYVVVENVGTADVDVSGWWVRDAPSARHPSSIVPAAGTSSVRYVFGAGTVLRAGRRVTVHVGAGVDTSARKYWGLAAPVFDNVNRATGMGDGAYLLDPDGDIRARFTYPCVVSCGDPATGKLVFGKVMANPPGVDTAALEYLQIRSKATARLSLDGYVVVNIPYTFHFRRGSYIEPGETITLRVGKYGVATRRNQHWGLSQPILNNSGDVVRLQRRDATPIACVAYGTQRC